MADTIRVAVASNFGLPMQALVDAFEQESDHRVDLIYGSTGKLFAQIIHGAPFDAYFAADVSRPALLEQSGHIQPGSRFTYALGQLVLWSPDSAQIDVNATVLSDADFRYIAIANPTLAPYGLAAKQVLERKGLWETLQKKLVRGENIGQTYHFVQSGNAALGFISRSQFQLIAQREGSYWFVPPQYHQPIEQQAVSLTANKAVADLMKFVQRDSSKVLIQQFGYVVP